MIKRFILTAAAVLLGLFAMALPVNAEAVPTSPGCTAWNSWVQSGYNSYYQGQGNITCNSGRYRAKNVCRNLQTNDAYVVYGTVAVYAPGTATATCNPDNVVEQVVKVDVPLGTGVTGCVTWSNWVMTGYNSGYYGRGTAQCDTGSYRVQITCHNQQTGQNYVIYGPGATAPNTSTTTCSTGNVAQTVTAVPL